MNISPINMVSFKSNTLKHVNEQVKPQVEEPNELDIYLDLCPTLAVHSSYGNYYNKGSKEDIEKMFELASSHKELFEEMKAQRTFDKYQGLTSVYMVQDYLNILPLEDLDKDFVHRVIKEKRYVDSTDEMKPRFYPLDIPMLVEAHLQEPELVESLLEETKYIRQPKNECAIEIPKYNVYEIVEKVNEKQLQQLRIINSDTIDGLLRERLNNL